MTHIQELRDKVLKLLADGYPLLVLARYAGLSRDTILAFIQETPRPPHARTVKAIEKLLRICKSEEC